MYITCMVFLVLLLHPAATLSFSVPPFHPPPGELWRLEDDMEGEEEPGRGGCAEVRPRSQSPFSHFRARAAYLRKSLSVDDHLGLGSDYGSGIAAEGKASRGSKGKLKRKFVSLISCFLLLGKKETNRKLLVL